jgi:hypothetical protein
MKAGLLAPLYLSVSWVLTVSYQLFTDTAVKAVGYSIGSIWSNAGLWINNNSQTLVFIYAFTWIFVLSSVIPSVILGKERGVLTQYAVVLILSLIAFFMADILKVFGIEIGQLFNAAIFLQNPYFALVYLTIPYIVMLGLDARSRRMSKFRKQTEHFETVNKLPKPTPLRAFMEEAEKSERKVTKIA